MKSLTRYSKGMFCAALVGLAVMLQAQSGRGWIKGIVLGVSDSQGMSGVLVKMSGDPDNPRLRSVLLETRTDDSGRYSIKTIPYGDYRLEVSAPGFILCHANVYIPSDAETQLHVRLRKADSGASPASGLPDRKLMQEINDAWATLDPDKAAGYYDTASPTNVFFDTAPLKYAGWPAYVRGARASFADLRSIVYTVGDDATVHIAGSVAWGTATLHSETVDKRGRKTGMDLRWTPVWEKKGDVWLLVHEHLSAPLDSPEKK